MECVGRLEVEERAKIGHTGWHSLPLSYREFRMDPVDVDRLVGAFFFESKEARKEVLKRKSFTADVGGVGDTDCAGERAILWLGDARADREMGGQDMVAVGAGCTVA